MSLVVRAYAIFRKNGFFALFKAFIRYLGRLLFGFWRLLRLRYYRVRGKFIFHVGNIRICLHVSDDDDIRELFYVTKTENRLIKEILNEIKPNDIFWDIGANQGFYTLLAASLPGVSVVAFEPNPITAVKLQYNIAMNHMTSVSVLGIALADTQSTVKFETMENRRRGMAHIAFDDNRNTIEVKTSSGDKLVATNTAPRPDVVKIDVEGAEYLVCKGMHNILSDCRVIFCEVHPQIQRYGNSADDLENALRGAEFSLKEIQKKDDNTYHLKASKNEGEI